MKISCPHCDNPIEAGPEWYGQATTCPHCDGDFEVPEGPAGPTRTPAQLTNPYSPPVAAVTRAPAHGPDPMEHIRKEIRTQANASLTWGIVSFFCAGIILSPFAIYRGKRAQKLIHQYNIGHNHLGVAKAGHIIGIISLILNIIGLIAYVVMVLSQV